MPTLTTCCKVCGRELGLNTSKCLICGAKQTKGFLEDYPPKESFGIWTQKMYGNEEKPLQEREA
ncbi:hypothetical protein KJ603_00800 [Patescibacteria group bacterium]|nr:hypothetical protein [Patescibacteria group bacterium]